MSKPSVRQNILLRSVQRLLDEGEEVQLVVIMSTRHRLFVPYAALSGAAVFMVALVSGVQGPLNQVALAACGVAVAAMATTDYSVLASTTHGLVLCRSSRIRQYAKSFVRRLPTNTSLTMVASTVISSDWKVDGIVYTLTKRWEATMRQLAIEYP